MRIAIAGDTYYPGNNGQAIFTIRLAEGLARVGHDVHMFTTGSSVRYQRQVVNGVQLHLLPGLPFDWIHPGAALNLFPQLMVRRIFGKYPPDIVHLQDHYFASRGVALEALRQNIPIVGTNHFLPENLLPYLNVVPLPRGLKIRILWDLMLWTYNRLNLVTTPTETAAAILSKQKIRFQVIPISCGVDTERFTPGEPGEATRARAEFGFDPKKTLFLYVGRHDREKRIDLLIRGLALLREQGQTDVEMVLAGQGAAKTELQALVHTLGLTSQVTFLGYVDNQKLPNLFRSADIFTMPSPEELQSIATLEAMASAKPILAANARALPELVAQGVNGILFEAGSVESAAQGMAALANLRSDWAQMGRASRSRAVAHSLDNTISHYEAIYSRVAGLHPQGSANAAEMLLRPAGRD
jgi:1,2-diacylglycerol 3-alpha-glucosyltransferase